MKKKESTMKSKVNTKKVKMVGNFKSILMEGTGRVAFT